MKPNSESQTYWVTNFKPPPICMDVCTKVKQASSCQMGVRINYPSLRRVHPKVHPIYGPNCLRELRAMLLWNWSHGRMIKIRISLKQFRRKRRVAQHQIKVDSVPPRLSMSNRTKRWKIFLQLTCLHLTHWVKDETCGKTEWARIPMVSKCVTTVQSSTKSSSNP